jgi:hypothetical protein
MPARFPIQTAQISPTSPLSKVLVPAPASVMLMILLVLQITGTHCHFAQPTMPGLFKISFHHLPPAPEPRLLCLPPIMRHLTSFFHIISSTINIPMDLEDICISKKLLCSRDPRSSRSSESARRTWGSPGAAVCSQVLPEELGASRSGQECREGTREGPKISYKILHAAGLKHIMILSTT